MKEIQQAIYKKIDDLFDDAQYLIMVWMKEVAKREKHREGTALGREERTNYEFRIELSGPSFRMRWFNVKFVKRAGKAVRITKPVSLGESDKVGSKKFPFAQDWEMELILNVEEQASKIRAQLKHLMKAHQSLTYAAKAAGISDFKPVPIKQRVTITKYSISEFKQKL